MPRERSTELALRIAHHLGSQATRADLSKFTPDELVDAHAAVATNPFTAQAVTTAFDPRMPALKPYVDGEVIEEHPFRAIADGAGSDVPLLAGSTTEELNALVKLRRSDIEPDAASAALAAMGLTGDTLERYTASIGTDDPIDAMAQASTDRAFRVPLARLWEDRAALGAPAFAYQFAWAPAVGAAHCFDIPFAFDNLDAERVADGLIGPGAPQALADEMHGAWVRFITSADPGWVPYTSDRRAAMRYDVPPAVVDDPLQAQRELFA
jgi:para-nitrobenzyl esterase